MIFAGIEKNKHKEIFLNFQPSIFNFKHMKNVFFKFSALFLSLLFLTNCGEETPGGTTGGNNNKKKGTAKFAETNLSAAWNDEYVDIQVEWSETKWKISTKDDKIFESFSLDVGGDWTNTDQLTEVRVFLKLNVDNAERSGEISLINYSTEETVKMTITQGGAVFDNIGTKLTLNPTIKYQKVTGFGGMLNPSWTGNNLTAAEVEKLYGELGYNIIRMMIYPNKANWDLNTEIAKKAQQLGAIVFGSPWTPPSSMKSNKLNTNEDGAYLLPEYYADYAAHLKEFVDFQKTRGLDIYAVSVQNEPDWKVDYDGCSWTVDQMLNFVSKHGRSVGTKLMSAETVNNNNKAYTNALLNSRTAVDNFDIVATHLYGGGLNKDPLAKEKGKEFWMTEHSINESHKEASDPERNWDWEPSLDMFAKEIHDCMEVDMNAYVYWYLKRYYGMVADEDSRCNEAAGEVTKRGYIMAHYAKYATGRDRIEKKLTTNLNLNKNLLITSYAGENDLTVVLVNRNADSFLMEVKSPSDIKIASAIETTANKNLVEIDITLKEDKRSVVFAVSGKSMVSVKLDLQ